MTKMIDELVNKFLGWKLPKDFFPDGGIYFDVRYEPIGTNLFNADQAKSMFEYLLADEPTVLNNMSNTPEQVAKYIKQNSPDISKELAEHFKPKSYYLEMLNQRHTGDEIEDYLTYPLPKIEPVGYAVWNEVAHEWDLDSSIKNHNDMGHADNAKILPVYISPPSTEALQKDKAELIDKINTLFDVIKHGDDEHKNWLKSAINKHFDILQPKCMENE